MRNGASVVWHLLPLMNSFNKTEAAVFSCRLCFWGPFLSSVLLVYSINAGLRGSKERQPENVPADKSFGGQAAGLEVQPGKDIQL